MNKNREIKSKSKTSSILLVSVHHSCFVTFILTAISVHFPSFRKKKKYWSPGKPSIKVSRFLSLTRLSAHTHTRCHFHPRISPSQTSSVSAHTSPSSQCYLNMPTSALVVAMAVTSALPPRAPECILEISTGSVSLSDRTNRALS